MKTLYTLLFSLLVAPAFAQTAHVLQLSPADAAQAKSLHDEQVALEKKQAEFDERVRTTYLFVKSGPIAPNGNRWCETKLCPDNYVLRDGWNYNFIFSDDFKFIVPKPETPAPCSYCNTTLTGVVNPVGYTTDLVSRGDQ